MSTNDSGGTAATMAGTAKDEAVGLAHAAADSGHGLLQEARHEAAGVASEAADQARDLFGEARAGLASQAADQQGRAAASIRSLGDELGRMADASDGGLASDLVRQVADRTGGVAAWLEDRQPGDVLDEVAEFARRRPGVFLAVAAGAGVLAGRLTRGLKDASEPEPRPHRAPGAATSTPPPASYPTEHPTAEYPTAGYPTTEPVTTELPVTTPVRTSAYDVPRPAPAPERATTPSWQPSSAGTPAPTTSWASPASTVGGPAPVSGHRPAAGDGGTAAGDPLAGLTREDRP